ncbi:hypothetical protein Agub_g5108 [Astrephomene gubernaculifera]|uniref:Uncharacterized protein n=1 Tax=Astrephomene gubernaculifera TaxID=47775 RepID=A0AAD3DLC2_9CHLO|nr:hypothetical protein Agub_g5108 [Astrephomene gubernaculifera]
MEPSKVLDALNDISVKVAIGVAGTAAAGAAIIMPNRQQVEAASTEMYGRPTSQLLPNERRTAEFCAGYRRWKGFVDNNIYSWTRKLPGSTAPIVNPYKGPRRPVRQQRAEEAEGAAVKE